MESQSSLPIQNIAGVNPEISRQFEKKPDSSSTSRTSFKTSLSESIIDVYERSNNNIAVPDERKGVDRRVRSNRRRVSSPSVEAVINADPYLSGQKPNRVLQTENTIPTSFSLQQKKGSLIDIWA